MPAWNGAVQQGEHIANVETVERFHSAEELASDARLAPSSVNPANTIALISCHRHGAELKIIPQEIKAQRLVGTCFVRGYFRVTELQNRFILRFAADEALIHVKLSVAVASAFSAGRR